MRAPAAHMHFAKKSRSGSGHICGIYEGSGQQYVTAGRVVVMRHGGRGCGRGCGYGARVVVAGNSKKIEKATSASLHDDIVHRQGLRDLGWRFC